MSNIMMIITSAAIGAITSAVITLIGQILERKSRIKELLLTKSVDLALHRQRFVLEVAKQSGKDTDFFDPIVNTASYYKWLKSIFKKESLPKDAPIKVPPNFKYI